MHDSVYLGSLFLAGAPARRADLASAPPEALPCGVCGRTFKRKDHLRQHAKTHAPERDVCRCPREGCGRTYTTVFNLQSHILSFHEEQRPFVCPQAGCGRAFAMKVRAPPSSPSPHPHPAGSPPSRPRPGGGAGRARAVALAASGVILTASLQTARLGFALVFNVWLAASLGNLLERHIHRPHPRLTPPAALGVGLGIGV